MDNLIVLEEVNSTNTYVKENYLSLDDGVVVAATMQTAGRGRMNRVWKSPKGVNFYGTINIKQVHSVSMTGAIMGLAALETLRFFAPEVKFYFKWPNDIYVKKAKIAGILSESCEIKNGQINAVAVGLGVNVNGDEEFLSSIDQEAISLYKLIKNKINVKIFQEKLALLAKWYYIMYLNNFEFFQSCWKKENLLIGKEIELVDSSAKTIRGIFKDVDENGAMMLEFENKVEKFYSGDVKIINF